MDSEEPLHLDIQDLSNILQCVGFKIKSVTKDSHNFGSNNEKTIELSCNNSGIKVNFELQDPECNCPKVDAGNENEKWEMSGTSGGIQVTKIESHSAFQKTFSKSMMNHVNNELGNLVRLLRSKTKVTITPRKTALNTTNKSLSKDIESQPAMTSFSASSSNLVSPPRMALQIRTETPSRYRSLDTLNDINSQTMILPEPKVLSASQKSILDDSNQNFEPNEEENKETEPKRSITRQNTFTTSPVRNSHEPRIMLPARTSSLITMIPPAAILNLHQADKLITELNVLIQDSIRTLENNANNRSLSPSLLDMSEISVSKSQTIASRNSNSLLSLKSPMPYASSPNLSSRKDSFRSRLNTPKSHIKSALPLKPEFKSNSLKRSIPKKLVSIKTISPNFGIVGNSKKNLGIGSVVGNSVAGSYKTLAEKSLVQNPVSKLRSSFRSSLTKSNETEAKKKDSLYSHVKSTIPRASSAKK